MKAKYFQEEEQPKLIYLSSVGPNWKVTYRDDSSSIITIYYAKDDLNDIRYLKSCGSLYVPPPDIAIDIRDAIQDVGFQTGTYLIYN